MRPHVIRLHSLQSNQAGYDQLAQIYCEASRSETETVHISCSRVAWVDSNMSAPFAAIRRVLRERHGKVLKFTGLRTDIADTLTAVGFFSGGKHRQSMVPLRHFEQGQSRSFAAYTQSQLADKGLPSMTSQVAKRVFQGIDEIFQNFEIHAKSDLGLFACGQLYPRKSLLVFTLTDMGIGIPEVVTRALARTMRPSLAIDWAMTGNNTTRQGDVPGGLGLKTLRDFIRLNEGSLSVVSGAGYWRSTHTGAVRREITEPFPGTIVTIEVDTSDTKGYQMADEIDPNAVF